MESAVLEDVSVSYVNENDKVYTTPENGGQGGDTVKNYMRFVAVEDSQININTFDGYEGGMPDIKHSNDGVTWTQYDLNPIPLSAGDTLYIKGNNEEGFNIGSTQYGIERIVSFNGSTGKFECHGNIMSLLYGDDFEGKYTIPSQFCFSDLFVGCEALLTAPELPATTLANNCYQGMFNGCTNLTTAPELPATTLTYSCYCSMFVDCTSLTTAPKLPAPILTGMCYSGMFWGCTSLNQITILATDISAKDDYCFDNWLSNVASTGTFIKHPDIDVNSFDYISEDGYPCIPEGWTVEDAVL